ncbi:MAG TPA: hypothetical protein VJY35_16665 [Candidatus Eisenbacteria bacterium]|nr:hypothetical protein [Candidatus Eisenbacteria bacterium]
MNLRPILVLVCFSLAVVLASGQAWGQDLAKHERFTGGNHRLGPDTISVNLLNTGKTDQEAADDAQRARQAARDATRSFWLTFAVLVLSVVQSIAFWVQIHWSRKTLRQMESEERRRLRAYLFIESPPLIEGAIMSANPQSVRFNIKNSGQTPAYEVVVSARLWPRERIQLGSVPAFVTPADEERSIAPMGPGGLVGVTVTVRDEDTLTDLLSKEITAGRATFFLQRNQIQGRLQSCPAD